MELFQTVEFVRCMRLVSPKFPKKSIINFSRHSNSSSFVIHNYRLQLIYQSLNEKLFIGKKILDGIIEDFLPSDIPNNDNYIVFISILKLLILHD